MLNINSDTVCHIIDGAREFQAKEEVVIPDTPDNPADDWALQVLADHGDDLTYQEVCELIRDLEPDQQAELVALMWLGRNDYEINDWEMAVDEATARATEATAEYLLSTPMVADYLTEGLACHGMSCND